MNSQMLVTKTLLSFVLILVMVSPLSAETVNEVQQRIVSLQQNIRQAEQELQALQQELVEIRQEEPAITKEYKKVSEELEAAFAKANSEDEAAHKDAMVVSFKFNRVDRKHTRFIERKKEVEDSVAGMTEKVTEWKTELVTAQQDLEEARAAVVAQKQAAEKARLEAELKAAEQKAAARKKAEMTAVAAPVTKPKSKQAIVVATVWPDSKAPEPGQIAFARQEMSRLNKLPASSAPLDKVELEPDCGDDVRLEFLGDGIYTAVSQLPAGMCKMEVFRSDYWIDLPVTGEYRVIYDVTSISSPKLFVFEERLLR